MDRRAKRKKGKAEAKRPLICKPPKDDSAKVRDLEKRLAEALEQQTATSEILRVISGSPTDLRRVLDAVSESASRLCEASDAVILLLDGSHLRAAAHHGRGFAAAVDRPVTRDGVAGRAVIDRETIHVHDVREANDFSLAQQLSSADGSRTLLATPLLREGVAIGAILIRREEVRPFSDQQIRLLQTFADQAVIAIENVRLFNETREALEQQTATGEILRAISQSPTDFQPVFDTIVRNATRVCEAFDAVLVLADGNEFVQRAHYGPIETLRGRYSLAGTVVGQAIREARVIQVENLAEASDYPVGRELAQRVGYRTTLSVPLFRDGAAIGAITIRRTEVLPFSDKQIALLQTFADQAVIAVENVRLFTELQEKNGSLAEAHAQVSETLEQQTATSEILRAIGTSPRDAQPVFEGIARSAVQVCGALSCAVFIVEGDTLQLAATHGVPTERLQRFRAEFPAPLTSGHDAVRAVRERSVFHMADIQKHSEASPEQVEAARLGGYRTRLMVPMVRGDTALGLIAVTRETSSPFLDRQVELLQTFADQAIIAIENVRLFQELQARTRELTRSVEQLTALGEVGRAVSSTLDLEAVLTTIVSRAVQLSGLDGGVVFEYDEAAEEFVQRAAAETGGVLAQARRGVRYRKGEGAVGRTAITLEPVQVPDITVPGAYDSRVRENLIESGIRAILVVPMVHQGRLIGCLGVTRNGPGAFPAETIELFRTFATQSALAIQNARLFREIEIKSRQLEAASRHKSEFLANMSHELRTPLNAIIGFSEVLGDRMFGELNEKQEEYLKDIYASGQHLLSLINDILDLSKIEAGRMELELSEFDLPNAIDNALILVRERASRRGIRLGSTIDERLGAISGDERKVKQVLLNLLSNALKFTPEGGRIDVSAREHDGVAEVSVTDTGVGIAAEDQEAVFEEFRQVGTADKKVEGTGLGLALARKFIELHGGRIWVKSQLGQGSTFTFTLPVGRED